MNQDIIKNASDFLYVYDATLCNPNGDPDQENKPRMDYDTHTNLVTDTRLKRYIRDYLAAKGHLVFVNPEEGKKVTPESKLKHVINRMMVDNEVVERIFAGHADFQKAFVEIREDKKTGDDIFKALQTKKNADLNNYLLEQLIRQEFIDIRMFGGAFAVGGFTKPYTGAIQINWGYSLHKVDMVESNTIVTTMNDDNSTFGKDYRVHYSLLAFSGSMNPFAAKTTGLTAGDQETFREAVWNGLTANPTRSKTNQYPKMYVEIVYNEDFGNGYFGDLRQYIDVKNAGENVRGWEDLEVSFDRLKKLIEENSGEGKPIKTVKYHHQNKVKLT